MEEICPLTVRKQLTFKSEVKAPTSCSIINLHEHVNKYVKTELQSNTQLRGRLISSLPSYNTYVIII